MDDDGPAAVQSLPGWDGWTFEVTTGLVNDKPAVTAVKVTAPDGEQITPGRFKKVPLGLLRQLSVDDPARHVAALAAVVAPEPTRLRAHPYTDEHLRAVAAVYQFAVQQSVPPREVISAHFEVSSTTVDRWLAKTRKAGLLASWEEERAEHEVGSG